MDKGHLVIALKEKEKACRTEQGVKQPLFHQSYSKLFIV